MRKPAEITEEKRISVVNAFALPEGSQARFYPSNDPVKAELATIATKRAKAQQMRAMGISEATIRRKGLDERTLRHAEKRQVARAAEREETAKRVAANKQAVKEAGPFYQGIRRPGARRPGLLRRRRVQVKLEKALERIRHPEFFQRQVRERLVGEKDDVPF